MLIKDYPYFMYIVRGMGVEGGGSTNGVGVCMFVLSAHKIDITWTDLLNDFLWFIKILNIICND